MFEEVLRKMTVEETVSRPLYITSLQLVTCQTCYWARHFLKVNFEFPNFFLEHLSITSTPSISSFTKKRISRAVWKAYPRDCIQVSCKYLRKKESHKSSVIRQKGKSQNGCFKKTKHAKFSGKRTFLTPWYAQCRNDQLYSSHFVIVIYSLIIPNSNTKSNSIPLDTIRKLNVNKPFKGQHRRLLYVICAFSHGRLLYVICGALRDLVPFVQF